MSKQVAVFDYGSGNVRSAVNALKRVGVEVSLTSDFSACLEADGLVVPGVGAFAAVMKDLHARRGDTLIDRRLAGGRPVLGICVGMQVMFERGLEHGEDTTGDGGMARNGRETTRPDSASYWLVENPGRAGVAAIFWD